MKFYLIVLLFDMSTGIQYMYEGYYPNYEDCNDAKVAVELIVSQQPNMLIKINHCDQVV